MVLQSGAVDSKSDREHDGWKNGVCQSILGMPCSASSSCEPQGLSIVEEVAVDLGSDHAYPRREGKECYALWAEAISPCFNRRSQIGGECRSLRDGEAKGNEDVCSHEECCWCEGDLDRCNKAFDLVLCQQCYTNATC